MSGFKESINSIPWWVKTIIILALVICIILLISKFYWEIGLAALAIFFIWAITQGEKNKNYRRSGSRGNETHIYHHSNRGYSSSSRQSANVVRRKISALDEEIRRLEDQARGEGFSGRQDLTLQNIRRAQQQRDDLEAQL